MEFEMWWNERLCKCFEGDDWYKRWVQTVLYFI